MERSTDDLVKIVAAGAGLIVDGEAKSTDELIQIATAAGQSEAWVTIRNVAQKNTDELIEIAAAGDGAVTFEL
jgi:DNA replication protein